MRQDQILYPEQLPKPSVCIFRRNSQIKYRRSGWPWESPNSPLYIPPGSVHHHGQFLGPG